ncbi:hypothetical protein jhhlp_006415 [Lomentospora prolificans]|uniref:Uncharacterized protein n=1 Tax=Lomentospora prolificans TaxID=41688 RepID=A0A2N3N5W6_9PEZI|nr:hypothetical protein jhhlp_006415 [Lomentospora prolificans]
MGIDFKKAPPLPAPTETESTTPTELATDVSQPADEKSTYSLPEDGTPVTIKTRSRSSNQKTLLIEYTENHRPGASGSESDRRPSVRVRVTTPSARGKSSGAGRIQITETDEAYTTTHSRRRPLSPLTAPSRPADLRDLADDQSVGSYASATEESNVSRNHPIDIGIDLGRNSRRRRPASPLIPSHETETIASLMPSTQSEISAIPTDSFLDGSGPTRSPEGRWIANPPSAEKLKSSKTRTISREKVRASEKSSRDRSDRKHKSSKSRTSSASDKHGDSGKSPRRRSSRNHESVVSGADSSVVSSSFSPSHRSMDQHSMRSDSSSKSINNPKLLEAVEDAIRRLILPQLDSLRREQSIHEARRGSAVSAATSMSREDLTGDRRRLSDRSQPSRHKDRRDREGRHDFADASYDRESMDGSSILEEPHTPRRKSTDMLKTAAAAGALAGGLAGAALAQSPSDDKKQRRRKRAESIRSRSRASDTYTDDFDDDDMAAPAPPMPLMSEINASDVTRTSILSADTDRPHSASEEMGPLREVSRGMATVQPTTAPSKTPNALQQGLGTQHANISHGDLTALRNSRGEPDPPSPGFAREQPSSRHGSLDHPPVPEVIEDDLPPDSQYVTSAYDYYNTQDVPQHLRYEPYQPERRGLSPIYSVSGYTEGGSEGPQLRDSRLYAASVTSDSAEKPPHSMHSPASAHSNVMGRDFDQRSDGRSSVADYRRTMSVDGSDLDPSSRQAVRGVGANPDIVHVPMGVESHVASLVDGSMVDQSVLSQDYGQRDSTISYVDRPRSYVDTYSASPTKQSVDSRHYTDEDRALTPVSRGSPTRSREFPKEYDIDKHGRKVPQSRDRESPTESEFAITAGATTKAIKALKARGLTDGATEEAPTPVGVQRNKSFKERTLAGHEPATTPTHSVDRLDYEDAPKLGASGLPDLDHPMPEIGYVDDSDTHTNASVVQDRLDGIHDTTWSGRSTPKAMIDSSRKPEPREGHGLGITEMVAAGVIGAAAASAANQSRQASNEHVEEPPRTSDEKKRDTLGTNPFEGVSPVANPHLGQNLFQAGNYDLGYHTGSPGVEDEGYKSQGPNRTPDFRASKGVLDAPKATEPHDGEDPFYDTTKPMLTPHFSGMSHGMVTPFYDAATGGGIDRIESKDIIALMQELVARDAQRTARDTEIAATVMFLAQEMRMSFQNVESRIKQAEDVLVDELDQTEKTIVKTIGGPRPYPGSAGRSVQGGSQTGEDMAAKKGNIIRRALKGLRTSGTNDLTRIEDMLLTLLKDVDDLKAQNAQHTRSTARPSLDNLGPEIQYEQDQEGYEPEGRDAVSIASHPSQSGHLAAPRSSQRRLSENRVSTVHEAAEEDHHEHDDEHLTGPQFTDSHLMTPAQNHRGSSVPLDTPPQPALHAHSGSVSNENTPRTDKGKKHKSGSSSSWIPKISRWSETTASTVSKAFRGSGATLRKDRGDAEYVPTAHSRSGSDLAAYAGDDYPHTDPYGDDHLHTGFSDLNLAPPNLPADESSGGPPRAYMTPEDPKYKAHRNSLNLQHPQPRPGQTERFKAALESQAHIYDTRSHDWRGSTTSLHRSPAQHMHRYSDASAPAGGEYWPDSPADANAGPPRPPKEPLDSVSGTPVRGARFSKLQKTSPLPYHSVESGYGTATATHTNYTGSPKLENRNLSGALGVPTRRPSGPRAMTPKSPEEEAAREERRRKRDTFGTIASQDTDTF